MRVKHLQHTCVCLLAFDLYCMFGSIWIFVEALHPAPIIAVPSNILKSFKESVQTDAIYLDFRKSFDSIAHNELLTKLWCSGITGNL